MNEITGGSVNAVTNAQALTNWLNQRGIHCDGVSKESISLLLDKKISPDVEKALRLRMENALSSTAKLGAMLEACCLDGRIRGLLKYHGAFTGRWSGKLVQPQNFPRGMSLNIDQAIRTVMQQDASLVEILHGPAVEWFQASCGRCLFQQKGMSCGCRLFLNRSKSPCLASR